MGEKASRYPQTLVSVAKLAFKRPALSLRLIGVVESKSALTARIKRILSRPIPKSAKLGILGLLTIIVAAAILLPMAKENEDDLKLVAKEYRLKHPVSQIETPLLSTLSSAFRNRLPNLLRELTGRRRTKDYSMWGYSDVGRVVLVANERRHAQAKKALRKEYGDLLRPEKLYDMSTVANVNVFADNCRKIVKDVFDWQKFSFLTKEDIDYIAEDIGDFVRTYTRDDVPREIQLKILESLDLYLYSTFRAETVYQRERTYLSFDNKIKTLKLKLWQVIAKEPLTEKEKATFTQQKQWIYDYAESLPGTTELGSIAGMHRASIVFNDILNGFSMQPMSEEGFKEFKEELRGENTLGGIANTASCWSTKIVKEKKTKHRWPFPFGVVTGYSGGSDRVDFRFESEKPGLSRSVGLEDVAERQYDYHAYDIASRKKLKAPDDCTTDEKLEEWLSRQDAGDFYYDQESESIVSCRGAKMAVLDVNNWIESDRIPNEKLRDIIRKKPISRFSVSGFKSLDDNMSSNKDKPVVPIIAVESKSGHVALIRPQDMHPKRLDLKIRHRFEGWNDQWFSSFVTGDLKNPTKKSRTTQNANFTATLPNGVTVELVGICEHPSEGEQWWRPDGAFLKERPYKASPWTHQTSAYKHEYVFRVTDSEGLLVKFRSASPFTGGGGPRCLSKTTTKSNYPDIRNLYTLVTTSDRKPDRADITLLIGKESDWVTLFEMQSPSEVSSVSVNDVIISPPVEKDGKTLVDVVVLSKDKEFRVVAIDTDGKQYIGAGSQSTGKLGSADVIRMRAEFPLKIDRIKSIQCQTQEFAPVTFKNVSLRPEQKPAVEVEEGDGWGEPLNGLRMRLTAPGGTIYKRGMSFPLVLEIQNVSEKPIAFQRLYRPLNFKVTDRRNERIGVQGYLHDHIAAWANSEGSLQPGDIISDTCYLERLRFRMPSPLKTIKLQFALPTQKENPGSLPINKYSNAVTIQLKDSPFKHLLKSEDLPEKWTQDMDIVYREGGGIFYGDLAVHIDGKGHMTTVGTRLRKGQPKLEGRHEYVLERRELDELMQRLCGFKIEQLNAYDGKRLGIDSLMVYTSIAKGGHTFSGEYDLFGSKTKPVSIKLGARKLRGWLFGCGLTRRAGG